MQTPRRKNSETNSQIEYKKTDKKYRYSKKSTRRRYYMNSIKHLQRGLRILPTISKGGKRIIC